MHLAVSDGGLDAHDREAGENTGLHGLLDTGLDGADEFGGDVAAGDLILELEGLALGGVERLEVHQDLCELAGTTMNVDFERHERLNLRTSARRESCPWCRGRCPLRRWTGLR